VLVKMTVYRENEGEMLSAESRQDADRRRTPDCGCRIETPDIRTVLKNHACAEESNARDDVRRDPAADRWVTVE
jgi:hypothetical protein